MLPKGFEYRGVPKRCEYCGEQYMPNTIRQVYCTIQCNEKAKYKRRRDIRQKKGLCLQCGGKMDYPLRIKKSKEGKKTISYCSKCREKFREIKKRRVN